MTYIVDFEFDGERRQLNLQEDPQGPPLIDMAMALTQQRSTLLTGSATCSYFNPRLRSCTRHSDRAVRPQPRHAGFDFNQSKQFEQQVAAGLGEFLVDYSASTDKIDFWVPGFYLDVKEKRQKLTERWHLPPGVDEEYLVVLDELGTRKLMQHYPYGYFLIRDVPREPLVPGLGY